MFLAWPSYAIVELEVSEKSPSLDLCLHLHPEDMELDDLKAPPGGNFLGVYLNRFLYLSRCEQVEFEIIVTHSRRTGQEALEAMGLGLNVKGGRV